jgi:hypothetical protein
MPGHRIVSRHNNYEQEKMQMIKQASAAALAALALGAGPAFAAPAHADTADYLAWLQNHGVPDPLPNGTSLVSMGTQECAALREGKSESFLTDNLEKVGVGIAPAGDVVYAAHHYLCPDA